MWNLFFERNQGKTIIFSDGFKSGSFVPVLSEQHFKIQSHFVIFDPEIGEEKLYNDAASQDLRYMCELFGNTQFLY